jgi:trimethylamine--corrinoid protein Co-methyltransferase
MDVSTTLAERMGFTPDAIERMHCAALRVLNEIGLSVENSDALKVLSDAGVRVVGSRVFFEPAFIEEQLAVIRQVRDLDQGATRSEHLKTNTGDRLTVTVGDMCQYYHSPFTDEIELMSTADLIEATKCVESMHDAGLGGYVPGVPRDVPYQLQAIVECRIGAEFTRNITLDTLHPPEALTYLFEMAEALGKPLESGGTFSVSPLRLSGYEFDVAVRHAARWKRFWVTTYPMVGATAPIRLRSAWVLSIAEAIGGAVTFHLVGGGKPVYVSIGMFPFDLHTFGAAGGMPECAWMFWASAQVTRYYDPSAGYSMMLGTQAKRPGPQAGLEKGLAGAFGVMTGCNDLHYVGVMSFDDIFSPEQMVLDCELRDALEQLARGIPPQDAEQWVKDIREGVNGGYVSVDTTLDNYRDTYWFPHLFDRTTWHTFLTNDGKTARERACEELCSRLETYDYHPSEPEIQDVRRIFADAWTKLGGDPQARYLSLVCNG